MLQKHPRDVCGAFLGCFKCTLGIFRHYNAFIAMFKLLLQNNTLLNTEKKRHHFNTPPIQKGPKGVFSGVLETIMC
jgi:hypothetical protein